MRYILVLSLLLSFTYIPAMSRHRVQLLRYACTPTQVARAARPAVASITRSLCCTTPDDSSQAQAEAHKKELERLRISKKILLYSRPIVTVASVASIQYAAPYLGLSQTELIGLLMITATTNTFVFHTADERLDERMKAAQKKLDELD